MEDAEKWKKESKRLQKDLQEKEWAHEDAKREVAPPRATRAAPPPPPNPPRRPWRRWVWQTTHALPDAAGSVSRSGQSQARTPVPLQPRPGRPAAGGCSVPCRGATSPPSCPQTRVCHAQGGITKVPIRCTRLSVTPPPPYLSGCFGRCCWLIAKRSPLADSAELLGTIVTAICPSQCQCVRGGGGQPGTGQSTLYGDVKSLYGGAGGWDRRGCATWAPRSATRQGEEQHRHTERGSHTRRDKGGHSRQGGGAQQGGRGNWNSGNREPEWSGWQSVRMGGSDNKGDGLASQPRRYRVPGQPLLNRHHVGAVSRSPDGLFAQQEWEPIRGRPTVRGKRTYGGRPGQRVEEQGTWAAPKHSEAGDGRPVDRGVWTANTVKRPQQQPAHPQYANYWAPLTRKRHTKPHSAQSQHINYWAPRTRK